MRKFIFLFMAMLFILVTGFAGNTFAVEETEGYTTSVEADTGHVSPVIDGITVNLVYNYTQLAIPQVESLGNVFSVTCSKYVDIEEVYNIKPITDTRYKPLLC